MEGLPGVPGRADEQLRVSPVDRGCPYPQGPCAVRQVEVDLDGGSTARNVGRNGQVVWAASVTNGGRVLVRPQIGCCLGVTACEALDLCLLVSNHLNQAVVEVHRSTRPVGG